MGERGRPRCHLSQCVGGQPALFSLYQYSVPLNVSRCVNCETNEGNGEQMSREGAGAGPGRVTGMAWSQVTGTGRKVEVGMWLEVGWWGGK